MRTSTINTSDAPSALSFKGYALDWPLPRRQKEQRATASNRATKMTGKVPAMRGSCVAKASLMHSGMPLVLVRFCEDSFFLHQRAPVRRYFDKIRVLHPSATAYTQKITILDWTTHIYKVMGCHENAEEIYAHTLVFSTIQCKCRNKEQ